MKGVAVMNLEAVTRPMERVREQVVRLGAQWAKQGRYASEVALRNSASALTRTAARLDTLADRIADEPAVVESAVVAAPVVVESTVVAAPVVEQSAVVAAPVVEQSAVVAAPVVEQSAVVAAPSHGTSTTEARGRDATKKKHRRQQRAAR
jgi:ATP phosphoribosyltransferase regulatory subunit HisZ